MEDFEALLKRSEDWHDGYRCGSIHSLDKQNKILVEIWDKINDIEKLVKELKEGKEK